MVGVSRGRRPPGRRHPPGGGIPPPEGGTPRRRHPQRRHLRQGDPLPLRQGDPLPLRQGDPPDDYCCGRYASYWNAFLLTQCSLIVKGCDWHILVGNGERIKLHCLTRFCHDSLNSLNSEKVILEELNCLERFLMKNA